MLFDVQKHPTPPSCYAAGAESDTHGRYWYTCYSTPPTHTHTQGRTYLTWEQVRARAASAAKLLMRRALKGFREAAQAGKMKGALRQQMLDHLVRPVALFTQCGECLHRPHSGNARMQALLAQLKEFQPPQPRPTPLAPHPSPPLSWRA